MTKQADIGVVGLAVMGENLILNLADKGFTVACFNRSTEKVDAFIGGRAAGKRIIGCHRIAQLVDSLSRPRKVLCMIKAGQAVDDFLATVIPHLEAGDIIIDGGNCTLEPGSPGGKKAPSRDLPLCRAVPLPPGRQSNRSCRR
jgi:6-phosphogluconate dehydrogenase